MIQEELQREKKLAYENTIVIIVGATRFFGKDGVVSSFCRIKSSCI
jgi:hypothetical protein